MLIIQVKLSKFATYSKNSLHALAMICRKTLFTLQQYDVMPKKSRRKRDHACTA